MTDSSTIFFFFNDTATTEIYTLSLHDALPICGARRIEWGLADVSIETAMGLPPASWRSEEHTSELQSPCISYAVFCLKKNNLPWSAPLHVGLTAALLLYTVIVATHHSAGRVPG